MTPLKNVYKLTRLRRELRKKRKAMSDSRFADTLAKMELSWKQQLAGQSEKCKH